MLIIERGHPLNVSTAQLQDIHAYNATAAQCLQNTRVERIHCTLGPTYMNEIFHLKFCRRCPRPEITRAPMPIFCLDSLPNYSRGQVHTHT